MSDYTLKPLTLDDLDRMDLSNSLLSPEVIRHNTQAILNEGTALAWSYGNADVTLGFGGITDMSKGSGRLLSWAFLSRALLTHGRETVKVTRLIRAVMREAFRDETVHRIECTVPLNNLRWAERCGFTFESVMKRYAFGNDYAMYAILREDT